ncbi:MAG TPA: RNase P subunit p30 family protein [Candidatus Nanoarchaeia archaeon]|nr:RNase P subunit p30 family protein [Candidatus Nanoarchaeia archaeon]
MIIDTDNLNDARKKIEIKAKEGSKVIVKGRDDSFNRKILENKKVNILLSPEHGYKKDKLKQRDSGLNHILCRIAQQNSISIGIDFQEILNKRDEGKKQLAEHLARIMQNIKLCRKSKVKMILMNTAGTDDYGLRALLSTLGMPTDMAKMAVED